MIAMLLLLQVSEQAVTQSSLDVLSIVVGIGGAVLGAVVGIVGTLLTQRQQLKHQDRTRFHDRRLAAYADFLSALSDAMVARRQARSVQEHVDRCDRAVEIVNLVATGPVLAVAEQAYERISGLLDGSADLDTAFTACDEAMSATRDAMRREMGVDH
jgi:hypothetical protein